MLNMCSISGKIDQAKFDVMQLHARPELAARHHMVDDASGDVNVRVAYPPPIIYPPHRQRKQIFFNLNDTECVRLVSLVGVAARELGAGRGETEHVRAVLRRRLLPGAVHVPESRSAALHLVHVAGWCFI